MYNIILFGIVTEICRYIGANKNLADDDIANIIKSYSEFIF